MKNDLIGKLLGAYEMRERIGQGGMATVYQAYHAPTDRMVAVKVMLPDIRDKETFARRFEREAQLLASLQHIHIVPVFDYGEEAGVSYLVMPLLPGKTLEDVINNQPLALGKTATYLRQLAAALDYAHSRGLLHRDVKPSNIMIDESGNALLADFGLTRLIDNHQSKLTADSVIIGTPSYMSPEQGQGAALTPASDIYALGVVLYEMLAGHVPFEAETPISVIFKHVTEPIPTENLSRNNVPDALIEVVEKALAKEPEDRYASATMLADAFDAALAALATPHSTAVNTGVATRVSPGAAAQDSVDGEAVDAPPISLAELKAPPDQKQKKKQAPAAPRRRFAVAGGMIAALLIVMGIGIGLRATGVLPLGGAHPALLFEIAAHQEAINDLAYSPDGLSLVSASSDDTARVWSTDTQELLTLIEGHTADVLSVAYHPEDPYIFTGGRDSMGYGWNPTTGDRVLTNFEGASLHQVRFSPLGTYLAYTTGSTVSWNTSDIGTSDLKYLSDLSDSTYRSLAINAPETLVAVGDEMGIVRLLNRATGALLTAFEIPDTIIHAIAFHPDGQRLAVATDDGTITMWDVEGTLLTTWDAQGGIAHALAYTPSGRHLVAGYEDNLVRHWQLNTGSVVEVFNGHEAPVLSLTLNSDGSRLATGDAAGNILIWRMPE